MILLQLQWVNNAPTALFIGININLNVKATRNSNLFPHLGDKSDKFAHIFGGPTWGVPTKPRRKISPPPSLPFAGADKSNPAICQRRHKTCKQVSYWRCSGNSLPGAKGLQDGCRYTGRGNRRASLSSATRGPTRETMPVSARADILHVYCAVGVQARLPRHQSVAIAGIFLGIFQVALILL